MIAIRGFDLGNGGDILDGHDKDKRGSFDQVDDQVTQIRQGRTQGLWKNNADVGLAISQTNGLRCFKLALIHRQNG